MLLTLMLPWKRNFLSFGRPLLAADYIRYNIWASSSRIVVFIDTTLAVLVRISEAGFHKLVKYNQNYQSRFRENCRFVWGLSDGPLFLDQDRSYSPDTYMTDNLLNNSEYEYNPSNCSGPSEAHIHIHV
jgi:hypothetical protein